MPDLETEFIELKQRALDVILDDSVSWEEIDDDLRALSKTPGISLSFKKRVSRFRTSFLHILNEWNAFRASDAFGLAIQGAEILKEAEKTLTDAAQSDWLPGLQDLSKRIEAFTYLREALIILDDTLDEADGAEAEFRALLDILDTAIEKLTAEEDDEDGDEE